MGFFRHVAHRRVVVNLWSGTAIAGVVTKTRSGYCVIRDATVIESGSKPAPADGEIIVDRNQIDYIQVL